MNIRNEAGECKGPHSCPRDTGPSHGAPPDKALDNVAPADSVAPPDDMALPDGMDFDNQALPDGMDLDNEAPPDGMDLDNEALPDGMDLDNKAPPGEMDQSHDGRKEEAQSKVSEVKGPGAGMEAQSRPPLIK